MAHKRSEIRTAIASLLTGATTAGSNVFKNRDESFWQSELPALVVFTRNEKAVRRSLSSRQSIRTLDLKIEIRVETASGTDDALDTICAEVEDLFEVNQAVGGAKSVILTDTELEIDSEGEKPIGIATLTFELQYIE